jgi:hypothetical protein
VTCSLLFVQLSNIWTMGWLLLNSSPRSWHGMSPLKNIIFLLGCIAYLLFPRISNNAWTFQICGWNKEQKSLAFCWSPLPCL